MKDDIYTGKRVVLVGPAPHITEIDQKDYINSFDIVIRMNWSYPIHDKVKKMTGGRCDYLYINSQRQQKGNLPDSVILHPHCAESDYPKDLFENLKTETNTNPNMGMVVIDHVLSQNPKELYVTGISFFQTGGHHEGYVCDIPEDTMAQSKGNFFSHTQEGQIRYFMKHFVDKIKADKVLTKIINEYRTNNS